MAADGVVFGIVSEYSEGEDNTTSDRYLPSSRGASQRKEESREAAKQQYLC